MIDFYECARVTVTDDLLTITPKSVLYGTQLTPWRLTVCESPAHSNVGAAYLGVRVTYACYYHHNTVPGTGTFRQWQRCCTAASVTYPASLYCIVYRQVRPSQTVRRDRLLRSTVLCKPPPVRRQWLVPNILACNQNARADATLFVAPHVIAGKNHGAPLTYHAPGLPRRPHGSVDQHSHGLPRRQARNQRPSGGPPWPGVLSNLIVAIDHEEGHAAPP